VTGRRIRSTPSSAGSVPAVRRCQPYDPHATLFILMGPDHERITCSCGGLENKLPGVVKADVIRGPIA